MPIAPTQPQKIFRIRRDYNAWVADESMEDYALRYTPRGFRKWSEFLVANTAFGATSFLALEAIGAAMVLGYGFANALWAIVAIGVVVFLTALPISVCAARSGLDMDLLTRGAGFGYLGSTVTSLVYASFTFIFFAIEAAILALALQMAFGWPLGACYLVASLGIVPLVMRGITLISRLQWWTQPVWIALIVLPYAAVLASQPQAWHDFTAMAGTVSHSNGFDALMFGAAATVAFSLVVQVGEQVDYLRFLPERTARNRVRWWAAVLVGGPGWIVPGMIKMLGGAFLAFVAVQHGVASDKALDPTQTYRIGFGHGVDSPAVALALTTLFVVVSQVKINITNAYAGSLAWSNFFARLTHSHPGRVVWLVFNVLIALLLMNLGVFHALERVLGLYGHIAIAWVGALVADLVINKPLGLSPAGIEFRRAYLFDVNPVGLGAMGVAAALGIASHGGLAGPAAQAFSPFIALLAALVASPLIAWATRGRFYIARVVATPWRPGEKLRCTVCENTFESDDMAHCPAYAAPICSLCCTLEARCHDRCKTRSRIGEQVQDALAWLLPAAVGRHITGRIANVLVVALSLIALIGAILALVHESPAGAFDARVPLWHAFALLSLAAAVAAWWIVLAHESRRMAHDESMRQNQLLSREVEAHRRTDAALKTARDHAEAANRAKTRYVAGMTHELRTPLNGILGYAQILLKDAQVQGAQRGAVQTIQRSGEHLRGLVDGLLELARIEAGKLRLDIAPLPMHEFLQDVVRMVAPQAAAKGLSFELRTLGRVPPFVRADAKRLRQILINLLGNAVRFTDRGSVTLLLDHRHAVARFSVVDTGIGIAEQDLERIFLPFERGTAGRRSSEAGTGLGLTITHLLTQLMGGELTVHSRPGEGSTFTARLYLSETKAPAGAAAAAGRRAAASYRPVSGYIGERRTLLVVDDQPMQRHLLAGMLLPLGFRIREAASGHEALQGVLEHAPDAVLLDISMDGIDGWETAQRIRAAGLRELPILIVSADPFGNQPERLAAALCQGFVDKPVIESELLAHLQRVLQLEWVAELARPAWATAPRAVGRLPADCAQALLRAVRLGHPRGVRDAIDTLESTHPRCRADAAALRELADRFAWPELLDRLSASLENDESDESDDPPEDPRPGSRKGTR